MKTILTLLFLISGFVYAEQIFLDSVSVEGETLKHKGQDVLVAVESTGAPYVSEFFVLDSQVYYRDVTGTVTTNTVQDAVLEEYTATTAITDYQVGKTYERNVNEEPTTWTSSDEAVATVDSTGFVNWVSSGTATITATMGDWTSDIELTLSSNAVDFVNIIDGAATYWREAVTGPIDAALTADAGGNDDELFDTRNWSTHTYVRNASAWAYQATGGDTDPWTGLAVWASGKTTTAGAQSIRGTLISPNVVACAWHNRPGIGHQYKWLGTDDVVYTRTVTARIRIGATDACLVLLDSPLPAEVEPLQILPSDWQSYLFYTDGTFGFQLPAITVNRNLQAAVVDFTTISLWGAGYAQSRIDLRRPYYQIPVTGDSGSPQILTDGTNLILVSTWFTSGGGGTFLGGDVTEALGSSAIAPTVYDITSYPDNGPPAP